MEIGTIKFSSDLGFLTSFLHCACTVITGFLDCAVYALQYLIPHHLDKYNFAMRNKEHKNAEELLNNMINTLETEEFRNRTFQKCGNALSLQNGLKEIQNILVRTDKSGSNMERIFRYGRMLHEEGDRMYEEQLRTMLDSAVMGDPENTHEIVKMGMTLLDRIMLALRGIWESPERTEIPTALKQNVEEWLKELSDPILERLWCDTLLIHP